MLRVLHKAFLPGVRGAFRFMAALVPWPAVPSFLLCSRHFCDCGHLVHGPYPDWYQLSDLFWIFSFMAAAVLAVCSDMPRKFLFAGLLLLLAAQRLLMQGGFGLLFDVLLFALGAWLAIRAVIDKRKDMPVVNTHQQASPAGILTHPNISSSPARAVSSRGRPSP
jgi:hypothetical protein